MKKFFFAIFSSFFFLFFSINNYAWNALGHRVIANIAYLNLKPTVRLEVDHLVSYLQKEYPEMDSYNKLAFWPDSLRGQKIDLFTRWHYIDVAFSQDGSPLKNLIDTDHAVWAMNNVATIVKNNNANPFERARALAFLTHIVGDLHQPLHTVSRISKNLLDGDKGGNLFFVRYNNQRMNLHYLWDGGMGIFEGDSSEERVRLLTETIIAHFPQSYFHNQVNDIDADNWLKEGLNNAKQFVYNTPEDEIPSSAYLENGKYVAEKEAALAGYRLAKTLNQLLG